MTAPKVEVVSATVMATVTVDMTVTVSPTVAVGVFLIKPAEVEERRVVRIGSTISDKAIKQKQ